MHVLVTGGTGLVGRAAVDHLLTRGHTVRVFAPDASTCAGEWPGGVEPRDGDVASDDAVRGIAEGCDAVLHVVGIVAEDPPEVTLEEVNVQGTRRIVREAERAGVPRLVYVSSLGADTGESDYHRSKKRAEDVVREFRGDWLVVRPGNVYGPGDEVISLLLKMVRSLPALPTIGGGNQEFQPIWGEDLGEALAVATERTDLRGQVLEVAGPERTTTSELLDRFGDLADRRPVRIPVPEWLAQVGADVAEAVGFHLPVNADQITMLQEGNVIQGQNALQEVLGVQPTPLADGLSRLADTLPEKLPSEGVGAMVRQRYWADIERSRMDADALFGLVQRDLDSLTPDALLEVGAEPGTPRGLTEGATVSMAVPLRGTIQVRVEEIKGRTITCMTLDGHYLAGAIQFETAALENGRTRFEIRSFSRASRLLDKLGMDTIGRLLQKQTWKRTVEEVVRRSGGEAPEGTQVESRTLDEPEAAEIDRWCRELAQRRHREDVAQEADSSPGAGNRA